MPTLALFICFAAAQAAEPAPAPSSAAASAPLLDTRDMVLVPAGEFLMGSADAEGYPNERPRHKVFLDAFWIDKFEVTTARYRAFAEKAGLAVHKQPFPDKDDCPVLYVDWNEAQGYCRSLGRRLPTEAEWEKAARGGSPARYSFGDDERKLGDYAWYWDNSGKRVHPVGKKNPNAFGIYDMHGNALEWTADHYNANFYSVSPERNPQGPAEGGDRVVRGGSVYVSADLCRCAQRMKGPPANQYSARGFRCAAPAAGQSAAGTAREENDPRAASPK